MANLMFSDTSLWLHNKLGYSNDSWISGSICAQLNKEVLRNIKECFADLQTQVKLKLLLSFFQIPRRSVTMWKVELDEIIEVAGNDTELWVSMIAETMKTLPATGSLNTEISEYEETRPIFTDMVNDLKKLVTKHSDLGMLPLECQYLNKAALVLMVGQQPAPVKHFTLKRKPKSAALRAELLQKSSDAQSHLKKSSAPTIPLRSRGMPRKMTDTTPLKGIPSRVPTGGFRSPPSSQGSARPNMSRTPAGRKDGGIKLLEITEQPLGYAAAKKRKRQQDLEEQQKRALEAQVSVPTTTATTPTTPTTTTPDYAAGLTATSVYTQPATPAPATIKEPPSTPIPAATTVLTHTTSTPTPIPSSPIIANTISGTTTIIRQTSIGQNSGNTFTLTSPTPSESIITTIPKTPQKPIIISQQTLVPASNDMKNIITTAGSSNSPIIIKTENKQQIGLQTVITSTHSNIMNSPVTITQRQLPQQIQQHHILQQSPQHHQQQQQTKIVQIKTAPTMMMSSTSTNSIQNMPPLISTQQPTIVSIQNMNMQGRKTVTISANNSGTTTMSSMGTKIHQIQQPQQQNQLHHQIQQQQQQIHVQHQPQQQQQQTQIIQNQKQSQQTQIITSGTGPKFTQVVVPPGCNVQGKTILLANPNMLTQKGVILRSIGPGGNTIYQQIPVGNVSGLSGLTNIGGTTYVTGPPGLIKTSNDQQQQPQQQQQIINQMPALVPTSSYHQTTMPSLTPVVFSNSNQQQMPTLITNMANMQQGNVQQTQTIIRPVITSNQSGMTVLPQGLTLIQRPGQKPQLVQTIQQHGQPQQIQRTIITQQQPQQQFQIRQQPTVVHLQQNQQQQQLQQQQPQIIQQPQQQQQPAQRKGLSLSNKHALEAHAMFKNANSVTRPDKALILGFMAGYTENPRPSPDNVLVIKLGESKENVRQEDGTSTITLVESYIKLDYNTGKWQTFKKHRRINQNQDQNHDQQNITQNSVVI